MQDVKCPEWRGACRSFLLRRSRRRSCWSLPSMVQDMRMRQPQPTSTICLLKKVYIVFEETARNRPVPQCCVDSSSGPRAQGWNAAANGRDVYRLGWSRAGHVHKARLLKPPAEETGNIKDVKGQKNMQIISVLQHLYSHILSLIRQGPDWPGGRKTWSGPCGRAVKLKNLFEVLDTPKPKFIWQLDSLLVGASLYDRATNANTKKSRRTFECILRGQQVIEREMPQSAQTDWSVRTLAITKTGYCIIVFQKNKDSNGKMDTQTEEGQTMNAGHTKCN